MNDHIRLDTPVRATWTPADLFWLGRLLRGNARLLLAFSVAGLLAMVAAMLISGPVYDVSAKVLVRIGREMTASSFAGAKEGAQAAPVQKRPEDIASEVEILTNPGLIQKTVDVFGEDFFLAETPPQSLWQYVKYVPKVVRRWIADTSRQILVSVGLRPPTTPLQRVAAAIAAGMRVEPVRKSDVIEVKLGFPDPAAGEAFLAKFLEFAMASHVDAYRRPGEKQFFLAEREARSADLRDAEQRLLAVRTGRDAIWSGPEQRALLLKAETDLQQQQNLAMAEAMQSSAEIANARLKLAALSPEMKLSSVQSRSRTGDDIAARLNQFELDLVLLRARYGEGSPEIGDVKRQIDSLRLLRDAEPAFRTDSVTTGPNPQFDQLSRDLAVKETQREGLAARMKELSAQIANLRAQSSSAQALEIEIAHAERDIAQLRRSIDLYDRALEEARISEAMDATAISNLKLIMAPAAELVPSSPPIGRSLLIGLAGGLALGLCLALARDFKKRHAPGMA